MMRAYQRRTRRRNSGFTMVELVIAIVLLGIVSATVSSRWFSVDAFTAETLKSQLLSQARLAQRNALANSSVEIALVVSTSAGDWRYQIFQDAGSGRTLLHEISAGADGVDIEVAVDVTQSITPGVNLDVAFDSLGNIKLLSIGGVPRDFSSGIELQLMGLHSLCISPLGYAHDGSCV